MICVQYRYQLHGGQVNALFDLFVLYHFSTVANHMTSDVCFIPIMGTAILKVLPAHSGFRVFMI